MKKVCIIATDDYMYDPRVYWREAVSLSKDYDVTCIMLDDGGNGEKSGITNEGITYYKFSIVKKEYKNVFLKNLYEEYTYSLDSFKQIYDIINENYYDVFHIQGLYSIFLIKYLKQNFKKAKIIYESREYHPDGIRDYNKTRGIATINKYLYSYYMDILEKVKAAKSNQIIVTDKSIYTRFKWIMKNRTEIIYNFTNIKITDTNKIINKKYDLIYCGGITVVRGILQIIKAVKLAKDEGLELKCLLVGPICDLNIKAEMDSLIEKNNLKDNIIVKGKVNFSEIPKYLKESKIGMVTLLPIPKYKKNIPMKQFEYMAYGLPVIGSNLPPIEQFTGKGKCGILVNPESTEEIYGAIKNLLTDKNLYNKCAKNGIKLSNEVFNWGKSEKKLLYIYEKLLTNIN